MFAVSHELVQLDTEVYEAREANQQQNEVISDEKFKSLGESEHFTFGIELHQSVRGCVDKLCHLPRLVHSLPMDVVVLDLFGTVQHLHDLGQNEPSLELSEIMHVALMLHELFELLVPDVVVMDLLSLE